MQSKQATTLAIIRSFHCIGSKPASGETAARAQCFRVPIAAALSGDCIVSTQASNVADALTPSTQAKPVTKTSGKPYKHIALSNFSGLNPYYGIVPVSAYKRG